MGILSNFMNLNRYEILARIVIILLVLPLHEFAHGWVARKCGDDTAEAAGRLTLNPLAHVDPFGAVLLLLTGFGWAKPVPVDMRNFKHPKRDMAITALAGPVSNVLICCIVLFIYGLIFLPCKLSGSSFLDSVLNMVYITAYLSIALAIFNIIPIPPLDGSKVLFSLMSDESYYKLMRYERYGMALLMLLLLTGVLDVPLEFLRDGLLNGLEAIGTWPVRLLLALR